MIVAIHQPNYFPWLGYFYKIFSSDAFVFHDAVEFSTSSYTKRCKIRKAKTSSETAWLSIPITHPPGGALIRDIQISEEGGWARKHLRKIENTYAGTPFFHTHFEWLSQQLTANESGRSLSEVNERLIRELSARLGITSWFIRSSELQLEGKGASLNLAIATKLMATEYIAGIGSVNYEEEQAFSEAGVRKVTHDLGAWLKSHPYDQGLDSFTPGLSILDALFHLGASGIKDLFVRFHQEQVQARLLQN